MAPIKAVSTIMQNTVEWINLLPAVKAASTGWLSRDTLSSCLLPSAKYHEAHVH